MVLQSSRSIDECAWCFVGHRDAPADGIRRRCCAGDPLFTSGPKKSGSCLSVVKADGAEQTAPPGAEGPSRYRRTHNWDVSESPVAGSHMMSATRPQHALLQSTASGFECARCAAQCQISACCHMNVALYVFWQAVRGQLLPGCLGRTLCHEQFRYIIKRQILKNKIGEKIPAELHY